MSIKEHQIIIPFSKIEQDYLELVGVKGLTLGRLLELKIPVPNGFILTTQAFEFTKASSGLTEFITNELSDLDPSDGVRLENVSKKIRNAVVKVGLGKDMKNTLARAYGSMSGFTDSYVAIRSSPPLEDLKDTSYSGQFSTFLNVKGKEDLFEKVILCWASLYTPQNIFYSLTKGYDVSSVSMAVVVQKMVQAEVSGILFTVNPIDNDNTKMVIEAVLGLGEALVSGQHTPDSYVLNKETDEILEKHIVPQEWMLVRKGRTKKGESPNVKVNVSEVWKSRQKLENKYIQKLAKIGKATEEKLGEAQDIEWVYEGGKIWIVQTRPIKTYVVDGDEIWKKTPTLAALRAKTSMEKNRKLPPDKSPKEEKNKDKKEKIIVAKRSSVSDEKPHSYEARNVILSACRISGGETSGVVKVVSDIQKLRGLHSPTIIVTPTLIPQLFDKLSCVVGVIIDSDIEDNQVMQNVKALEIPVISEARVATKVLRNGEPITLDGTKGEIIRGETDRGKHNAALIIDRMQKNVESKVNKPKKKVQIVQVSKKEEITTATKVFISVDKPDSAVELATLTTDGVGMVRLDQVIIQNGVHPEYALKTEEGLKKYYNSIGVGLYRIARSFEPRPVIYQLANLDSTVLASLENGDAFESDENNPMLGYRGVVRYLDAPEVVKLELKSIRAIRNKENVRNVWVAIPYVRTVKELREMKHIISSCGFRRSTSFKLFFVVDIPSIAIRIENALALGVDGVIVNVNNLSQFVLGYDKTNPKLSDTYERIHPSVLELIEKVVRACSRQKVISLVSNENGLYSTSVMKKIIDWGASGIVVKDTIYTEARKLVAEAERSVILRKRR